MFYAYLVTPLAVTDARMDSKKNTAGGSTLAFLSSTEWLGWFFRETTPARINDVGVATPGRGGPRGTEPVVGVPLRSRRRSFRRFHQSIGCLV